MGIMHCPKHGPQGFIEVCEHVDQDLEAGRFPVVKKIAVLGLWMCSACYKRTLLKFLKGVVSIRLLSAYSEAYDSINRSGCCVKCLRETEYYAAKKAGQPLPFPGYERTLTYQELAVVEEIEQWLKSRYAFPISQDPYSRGEAALWLEPGTIEKPFTLHFYYITAAESQQQLLALIDEFFAAVQLKQRRIMFFEAERWHQEIRANGSSSYQRLPALLVREVVVE